MKTPEVLYEDNHLLVVVKPIGMPVQADASGDPDLATVLKAYIKEKYQKPGEVYLGIVHRLDRPVGGVMVFARTSKAAARLSDEIRRGGMDKRYLCAAEGHFAPGAWEDWLLKDAATNTSRVVPPGTPGAKDARLIQETVDEAEGLSLARVELLTGRSHQIRVQFASRGHALWGDARYNPHAKPGQDVALFAAELSFTHPTTKERLTFSARPHGRPWNLFSLERSL